MRTMAAAKTPRDMFYFCSEMRLLASVMDDSGTLTSYSLRLAAPERKLAGAKVASNLRRKPIPGNALLRTARAAYSAALASPRTNAHRTVVVLEGSVQWGCINPIRPCQAAPCQQSQAKPSLSADDANPPFTRPVAHTCHKGRACCVRHRKRKHNL
jgi:hypothetical protein